MHQKVNNILVTALLIFAASAGRPARSPVTFPMSGARIRALVVTSLISFLSSTACNADMLTFPLPKPLKNNYVLARSAECFADSEHRIETNPVKKLRQDNALTMRGREEAKEMAKSLSTIGFSPSFIWTSNTERF